ncbi:MAG: enoyl-CoA hydratase/isomerase family protein, partial [Deltaproteobacteria bacterium]|nr:enoyl-CoA hydratase/isomerase family protein [Deltaproteobacteria bacterium]
IDKRDNVCTLTLNRPEKRNSLSIDLVYEIYETFQKLADEDEMRTVIIRGHGDKSFCAGFDIASLPTKINPDIQDKFLKESPFELAMKSIINYPYPVIAMLNGSVYGGGCELAISCDIRIGADDIRIGMTPAKIGVVYSWKGLRRFLNVVGLRSTKEMFFTAKTYSGHHLFDMGLVDYLIPRSELESFTNSMAQEIAQNAPLSLKGNKRILNLLLQSEFAESDKKEAEDLSILSFASEDLKEGQSAFLEKRKPVFKGK